MVPKGARRTQLHVTAEDLRGAEKLRSGLRLIERARSQADLRRALKRIASSSDDEPTTAAQDRKVFRAACG